MKENTQELQSILRRRRGDESRLANKVGEYLSSRKKSNKVIHKSLRDLKSRCKVTSLENETPAIIEILREVEGVALAVFESLLSYISVAGPWYRSWCIPNAYHAKRMQQRLMNLIKWTLN